MVNKTPTRVLVIAEDNTTTDLLGMTLLPELFKIYSADSVEKGIETAKSCQPHLVISDLILNGSDGRSLWMKIREVCEAPILVLSAIQNPDMIARVLDGGADGFLTKPVPNEVLVANINNLTRRARFEKEAATAK